MPWAHSDLFSRPLHVIRPCSCGWARTSIAKQPPTTASSGRCWRRSRWVRVTSLTRDVRAAARAFTGWFVLRGQLRYLPHEHDERDNAIPGPRRQLHCGRRAADRARTTGHRPDGRAQTIPLADQRDAGTERHADRTAGGVVRQGLRRGTSSSRPCYGRICSSRRQAYRQRVKCPVEFAIGIIRALEGMVSATQLVQDIAGLGQDLCRPPTVKGWTGRTVLDHGRDGRGPAQSHRRTAADAANPTTASWTPGQSPKGMDMARRSRLLGSCSDLFVQGNLAAGCSRGSASKRAGLRDEWRRWTGSPAATPGVCRADICPSINWRRRTGGAELMLSTRRDFLRAALGTSTLMSLGSVAPDFLRRSAVAAAAQRRVTPSWSSSNSPAATTA